MDWLEGFVADGVTLGQDCHRGESRARARACVCILVSDHGLCLLITCVDVNCSL
jgi:hypothetical protein